MFQKASSMMPRIRYSLIVVTESLTPVTDKSKESATPTGGIDGILIIREIYSPQVADFTTKKTILALEIVLGNSACIISASDYFEGLPKSATTSYGIQICRHKTTISV